MSNAATKSKKVAPNLQNGAKEADTPTPQTPKVRINFNGFQLKLAATNALDDLIELLLDNQAIITKFYEKRTLKSSVAVRKILLQVAKTALNERKVILGVRGKKRQGDE
jgi:hypothetical protein